MAKLIVVRPRDSSFVGFTPCHIFLDGRRAASLAEGMKVEIPLSPGRHELSARKDLNRSPVVPFECEPEDRHEFRIVFRPFVPMSFARQSALSFGLLSPFVLWMLFHHLVFPWPQDVWIDRFFTPIILLFSFGGGMALSVATQYGRLSLEPGLDLADGQALTPGITARRGRLTLRAMMIAVAVLAVLLGIGVWHWREARNGSYRSQARVHRSLENHWRHPEKASRIPEIAAHEAALADYHAAMAKKYEDAAARGLTSVEPDPPPPPP